MAQDIASLILAHELYIASSRGLWDDVEKACKSIADDSFIADMNDFKLHNEFLCSEMKNLTSFFDNLTKEAESLTEEFRKRRVAGGDIVQPLDEILQVEQERVKAEVERVVKAMVAEVEPCAGQSSWGGNSGEAAPRGAGCAITSGSHTRSPMEAPREAEGPSTSGSHTGSSVAACLSIKKEALEWFRQMDQGGPGNM
jgi:hypothetical protein